MYNNQYLAEFADGSHYTANREILGNSGANYPELESDTETSDTETSDEALQARGQKPHYLMLNIRNTKKSNR